MSLICTPFCNKQPTKIGYSKSEVAIFEFYKSLIYKLGYKLIDGTQNYLFHSKLSIYAAK